MTDSSGNSTPAGGWSMLQDTAVDRITEVGTTAFGVYCVLLKHSDQAGICWPKVPTIARQLGVSTRTVRTALGRLKSAGWIDRSEQFFNSGTQTGNQYQIRLWQLAWSIDSGGTYRLRYVRGEYVGALS